MARILFQDSGLESGCRSVGVEFVGCWRESQQRHRTSPMLDLGRAKSVLYPCLQICSCGRKLPRCLAHGIDPTGAGMQSVCLIVTGTK